MKTLLHYSSTILALGAASAFGQIDSGPNAPVDAVPGSPNALEVEPPVNPDLSANDTGLADPNAPVDTGLPEVEDSDGFFMQNAPLNEVFQFLAKRAGKQYFHSAELAAITVTGSLNENDDPLRQMEELAFQYKLQLYRKGNTVYALNSTQLDQLPGKEFFYQLKYLRPQDIEQIKTLIQPMLSPSGIVNFEPKTNTVIVYDNEKSVGRVEGLMAKIDKPKGQIVVEAKILSINSTVGQAKGVNWEGSLGRGVGNGTVANAGLDLNSILGLGNDIDLGVFGGATAGSGANVVLNSSQLSGVLRALNDANVAEQRSNPVVVTEDNEQAIITIIDRVPIIEATTNTSNSGGALGTTQVTFEIRYQIDESDPVGDPATTREIGITLAITPTLLPDDTIRLKMRPRTAVITEEVPLTVSSGVSFTVPRVLESTVDTIARIPDKHSLVIGGFYQQNDDKVENKVPIVGDIPVLNFFFKSQETAKTRSSLIFVVTPSSYDPGSETDAMYARYRNKANLERGHDWVDPENPGPAHRPNLKRTLREFCPNQETLYQDPDHAPDSFWNRQ